MAEPPTLAVWKFASCDGCQLTLLDCEDELLALAGAVRIAHFLEASSTVAARTVRRVAGRGLDHDAGRRRADPRGPRAVAGPGHHRRLRDRGRHPGAAQLRATSRSSASVVYASPQYIDTLATSTPIAAHVPVDFELRGCPIDKRQLLEMITALPRGPQARHPRHQRLHRVQAPRADLRDGRGRHALPRPGHARRLRRALPGRRPRLLRLLRPDERRQPARADRPAAHVRDERRATVDLVLSTFNVAAFREAADQASDAMTTERRDLQVSALARVEGEGALRVVVTDGAVTRGGAADLRAAAVLRGVPARPAVHRGHRHHVADLRHLPGRLPDQRLAARSRTPAASIVGQRIAALRRLLYCGEWISSHALHIYLLHAPDFLGYPDVIALARDHRDRRRTRTAAEEGRQRDPRGGRRPGDPPGQPADRRLLPRARARRAGAAGRAAAPGARRRPGDGRLGGRVRLPGPRAATASCSPCTSPDRYAIETGDGRASASGLAFPARGLQRPRRRAPGAALHRAARHARRTAATSPARWPGTRSTRRQLSPLARAGRRGGRARRRPAATRSAASSSARSRPSTRSTRRCGSSASYERPEPPAVDVPPRAGDRPRRQRGAARAALPPLRAGRRRADRVGDHRAADLAEPGRDRGRPARASPRPNLHLDDDELTAAVRADHPQLRPVHLLLGPLPRPHRRAPVSPCGRRPAAVIGVGNPYRRDDGAGPETVARLRDRVPAGVTVTALDGEPTRLMEAWSGAGARDRGRRRGVRPTGPGPDPPRARRPPRCPSGMTVATHGLGVVEAVRLAAALDRLPRALVVSGWRPPTSASVPACPRRWPRRSPRSWTPSWPSWAERPPTEAEPMTDALVSGGEPTSARACRRVRVR